MKTRSKKRWRLTLVLSDHRTYRFYGDDRDDLEHAAGGLEPWWRWAQGHRQILRGFIDENVNGEWVERPPPK